MDDKRFDQILKSFARSKSRRRFLGGTLGALLAGLGLRTVAAHDTDKEFWGKESWGKEGFGKERAGKESFDKEGFGKESFGPERFGPVAGYDLPVLGAATVSLPNRGIGTGRAFIRPDERPSASASVIRDDEALRDDGICLG
jgi:hypothetical protein